MDWKNAEKLLKRWYDGSSTPEEDLELKSLLRRPDLPEYLIRDRNLILALNEAGKSELSDPGFDDDVFAEIDRIEARRNPTESRFSVLAAAAAAIIIAAGLLIWFANYQLDNGLGEIAYTEQEIREAEQVTESTLAYISGLLNTGNNELAAVSALSRGLEQLEYLGSFNRGIKQLETLPQLDQKTSTQETGS